MNEKNDQIAPLPAISLSSSYRDPLNPECRRFPGSLLTKSLIITGVMLAIAVEVLSVAVSRTWRDYTIDAVALLAICIFLLRLWPPEIRTDRTGLHLHGMFGRPFCSLLWKDVAHVEPGVEGGAVARRLKLRADILVVSNEDGSVRIVHTPRHADRERLLCEMKQWGVKP